MSSDCSFQGIDSDPDFQKQIQPDDKVLNMLRLAKDMHILCAKFEMKQIHLWWVFIAADIEPSTEVLRQKKVGKSRQTKLGRREGGNLHFQCSRSSALC